MLTPTNLPERYAQSFNHLSDTSKTILGLLAVAGMPFSRTAIIAMMTKHLNIPMSSSENIKSEIADLLESKWLEEEGYRVGIQSSIKGPMAHWMMSHHDIHTILGNIEKEHERKKLPSRSYHYTKSSKREFDYEMRRAVLLGGSDAARLVDEYEDMVGSHGVDAFGDLVLCSNDQGHSLDKNLIALTVMTAIGHSEVQWRNMAIAFLESYLPSMKASSLDSVFHSLFDALIGMGRFDLLEILLEKASPKMVTVDIFHGVMGLLNGRFDEAIFRFEQGLRKKKIAAPRTKPRYESEWGLLFAYALMLRQGPSDMMVAEKVLALPKTLADQGVCIALKAMWFHLNGNSKNAKDLLAKGSFLGHYLSDLGMIMLMLTEKMVLGVEGHLNKMCDEYFSYWFDKNDQHLWWGEMSSKLKGWSPSAKDTSETTEHNPTLIHFFSQQKSSWENALGRLESILDPKSRPSDTPVVNLPGPSSRIAWLLTYRASASTIIGIQPVEQKRSAKGIWSAGRNIALKRFKENDLPNGASEQDMAASKGISSHTVRRGYWGSSVEYDVNEKKMIPLLLDHPYLFDADTRQPVRLKRGELSLVLKEDQKCLRLLSEPNFSAQEDAVVIQENAQEWQYCSPSREQKAILQALPSGMTYPLEAKSRLMALLGKLSNQFHVHGAEDSIALGIDEVDPEARLILTMISRGSGLFIHGKACPLGIDGPGFMPGDGLEVVMGTVGDRRLKTKRNFKGESDHLQAWTSLSGLDGRVLVEEGIHMEDPQQCLAILDVIRELGEERVLAKWPEGKAKRIKTLLTQEDVTLKFSKGRNWFEVQGEIKLPEGLDLELQELLKLLTHRQGKYLTLADGDLLKLSDNLLKDLQVLSMATEDEGNVELHPMLAVQLQHLEGKSRGRANAKWVEWKQRYDESFNLEVKLPTHFEADLRSYQWEGVQWMLRMAHWGAGVCLADDMGLGKTVQTLAVLAARAEWGPAVVICPTSLVRNWQAESVRFAPRLQVSIYGDGRRDDQLKKLGIGDVLLVSYGLVQKDAKKFESIQFSTLILDEAQALKNRKTKRRKAVAGLKADFKCALSGTPVENDVEELWSLFDILNPGLLGSPAFFEARFDAGEDDMRGQRLSSLRSLLEPFLLRRLKRDVLKELPPKTEVVLDVELSTEERALYETLRESAREMVATSKGSQRRLEIFAELMRLRRACCHPDLVNKGLELSSAKLEVLTELVQNLKLNGHRALIFSQFVDHLHLIRERLTEEGYELKYLDGQTRPKDRAKAVADFQAGEGDFFLISLKAGGVGLNLTAADYVIHMDPWWNPAVEDQASDRAHRIGQLRPVTVYRLVAKDTIEERIIQLHHQKRDLADAILEGQGQVKKVNLEELAELLI